MRTICPKLRIALPKASHILVQHRRRKLDLLSKENHIFISVTASEAKKVVRMPEKVASA